MLYCLSKKVLVGGAVASAAYLAPGGKGGVDFPIQFQAIVDVGVQIKEVVPAAVGMISVADMPAVAGLVIRAGAGSLNLSICKVMGGGVALTVLEPSG